ncbi:Na+/solute symporter [Kitasatospora sp. MMS16-BH015]|uniref:sodium:solute symporter family protein n=1 Tax=Kitasatospora sp. MMS16-BH015 TaxID=2018025 RepID=UPI000CA3C0C5|nr:sodium:solute symporter [Kitasatospora sp. MMS16-BH015]AUG76917.1 Na+/solute symporter [Kitasatospora sp. MMS16-BH015]
MTALAVIGVFLLLAVGLGAAARRGRVMDLEQWAVGGRGFGTVFVFLLLAGELYTTFTFLGAAGWAYGKGGPAFYILSYAALAYVLSYWLLPVVWHYAKRHGLLSQPDFFAEKYDSPLLGVLVALVGVVAMVPYLVLQLTGLGIIVSTASYGHLSAHAAAVIGAVALTGYVTVSGIHGSAWTAVAKDVLILGVVVFLGIYLPVHYAGGIGPMFHRLDAEHPGFLTLRHSGLSPSWFASTVLLSTLGFYLWPHTFAATYSAKGPKVFRRNAVFMPLYQLMLLFVFFAGFAAIIAVPGLKGADGDLSLLKAATATFDPWFVGVVGGAGVLTALVPGSLLLTTSATSLARNVYLVARPRAGQREVGRLAKLLVPVVAALALFFTFRGGSSIVNLLLMGYALVTQLFPALVLSLPSRRLVTAWGAAAGIVAGVATVATVTLTGTTVARLLPGFPQPVRDLNVGVVALVVNLAALAVVSALTRRAGGGAGGGAGVGAGDGVAGGAEQTASQ